MTSVLPFSFLSSEALKLSAAVIFLVDQSVLGVLNFFFPGI